MGRSASSQDEKAARQGYRRDHGAALGTYTMVVADILKLGSGSIIRTRSARRCSGGLASERSALGPRRGRAADETFGVRLTELIERSEAGAVPIAK